MKSLNKRDVDIFENGKIRGIKIRTFNTGVIIASAIIYLFLIFSTISITVKYHELVEQTDEYTVCEEQAATVTSASDYLTEQVRLYVQNMDIKYMEAYFEEANVTCRREKALEELEKMDPSEEIRTDLESALKASDDLMEKEIYAMKLISVANGYESEILPEAVCSMPLKAEDSSLEPQEMMEKARILVFDDGYQNAKELIYSHLSHFTEDVLSVMKDKQQESELTLAESIFNQRIFISILFVLNLLTYVVITILIVKPLSIHIKKIKNNDTLEIIGSYEFKYLALTYNDIYELNSANEKMLLHKAEHDALTGLLNRAAFDNLKVFLKEGKIPLALAVIDIDKFKNINDKYGHEAGDSIIKKVADLLKASFRSNDYVVRLGGDEFVVLMTNIQEDKKNVVERKFKSVNSILMEADDEFPETSLSVGVAFSEKGFDDELFEKADQALYEAKNKGRRQCRFHQDSMS